MNESSPRKEFALASRWLRLWGALIDSAIAILIGIPLVMWTGVWDLTLAGEPIPLALALKTALLSWTLIVALHGYLLYRYGQTIGKHCVDTAIVKTNGDPIDVKTIALRYLPVWTVSSIPMIGGLLSLVDVLFIARDDKRCVHDLIAGTKVVNVEDVPQAAEEAGASAA